MSETAVSSAALSDVFGSVPGHGTPPGHLLGYARVSTGDQDPALQRDALIAAGCARVWTDVASGSRDDRHELTALLDRLLPGDTLVVWRLDRLGRSLRHLIDTVTALDERGVGFRSLQESIDTTTSGGRLVFHIFGAIAEFERDLIRERTLAGLQAARQRGRRGGRPTAMTPARVRQAQRMYADKRPSAKSPQSSAWGAPPSTGRSA
jgi:DNA invertase Pin-like site-specific DNA recombinase